MEIIREKLPSDLLTDADLSVLLSGRAGSRYGLVKRALARADLVRLRRGVYLVGALYRRHGVNLHHLAERIYGPSYVSFESALSHHGWIPEGVYIETCACAKRSRAFQTPLGLFKYQHVPVTGFYFGVERLTDSGGVYFMASPWRALADYVYANRKDWIHFKPVLESLRIDEESLRSVEPAVWNSLLKVYPSTRVRRFIRGVQKGLGP